MIGIHDVDNHFLFGALFLREQEIHAVQRHAAVIADDASASVGIRKTGDDTRVTGTLHLVSIDFKHAVVVRLAVFKDMFDRRIHLSAVGFEFGVDETDPAERHDRALERGVGLQTDDLFEILIDITSIVGGDRGDRFFVNVINAVALAFHFHLLKKLIPKSFCSFGGRCEKFFSAVIRRVVALDEVPYIDFRIPCALLEIHSVPF